MKKNNKGFTLIELLAVVVILLAISVMAISSISAAIERNKAQQDEKKKAIIVSQAELYYDSHKNGLADDVCINIGDLTNIEGLDLTEDELKDSNGNQFTGAVKRDGGVFKYVDSCD